jgi:hypothetical protein
MKFLVLLKLTFGLMTETLGGGVPFLYHASEIIMHFRSISYYNTPLVVYGTFIITRDKYSYVPQIPLIIIREVSMIFGQDLALFLKKGKGNVVK